MTDLIIQRDGKPYLSTEALLNCPEQLKSAKLWRIRHSTPIVNGTHYQLSGSLGYVEGRMGKEKVYCGEDIQNHILIVHSDGTCTLKNSYIDCVE